MYSKKYILISLKVYFNLDLDIVKVIEFLLTLANSFSIKVDSSQPGKK